MMGIPAFQRMVVALYQNIASPFQTYGKARGPVNAWRVWMGAIGECGEREKWGLCFYTSILK